MSRYSTTCTKCDRRDQVLACSDAHSRQSSASHTDNSLHKLLVSSVREKTRRQQSCVTCETKAITPGDGPSVFATGSRDRGNPCRRSSQNSQMCLRCQSHPVKSSMTATTPTPCQAMIPRKSQFLRGRQASKEFTADDVRTQHSRVSPASRADTSSFSHVHDATQVHEELNATSTRLNERTCRLQHFLTHVRP